MKNNNKGVGFDAVFIHYQTKVCVIGGPEACFPDKCPEDGVGARRLGTNMTHMLQDLWVIFHYLRFSCLF